jgi:hypothetical protein
MIGAMRTDSKSLLREIEAFLAAQPMGESAFGKAAAGNTELIRRLRSGGRVWPETEMAVRAFILSQRALAPKRDIAS